MSDSCACGAAAVLACAGCSAPLCEDHALDPRRPRSRSHRLPSFGDLLRDFPFRAGIDAGQMWALRADVAERLAPAARCDGCWDSAFRESLARIRPRPLPAFEPAPEAAVHQRVSAADLLAAWSAAARPGALPEGVGTARFRTPKGWRIGALLEDRLVRDGEGSVRVQVGIVYLTRGGQVWIPGRELPAADGFPAEWLPAGAAAAGAPPVPSRHEALESERRRATAVLLAHGWPA